MKRNVAWKETLEDAIRGMSGMELAEYLYFVQSEAVKRGEAQTKEVIFDELKSPLDPAMALVIS